MSAATVLQVALGSRETASRATVLQVALGSRETASAATERVGA